jgi:NAD(P)-dependent dehydrogenase (short-subunit alcohol dehydrogenase family)
MSQGSVLVTGGAGGIGRSTCQALARDGWEPIVADIDGAQARSVAAEVGGRSIRVDLAELTEQELDRIASESGALAGVVNAAGVPDQDRFPNVSTTEWRRVLGVNLEAPFLLSQALSKRMVAGGSIVNIASAAGSKVFTASGRVSHPYSSSKAGLIMLTKTLACELAPRQIRVNCVSPGFVRTPIIDELETDAAGVVEELTPLGRWGEPSEIAGLVLYLLSDQARYITGANLKIDGGISVV